MIIEACDGLPDRSVTISLNQLMKRTRLSCPTVIESLARLEELGLVVSTTRQRGQGQDLLRPRAPAGTSARGLTRTAEASADRSMAVRASWPCRALIALTSRRGSGRPWRPYFFRVEHDLLRSDAFKTLGGSAIKVYLVIGLYSDFGTDWAYPSIRTIARAGRPEPADGDDGDRGADPGGPAGRQQVEGPIDGLPGPPPARSRPTGRRDRARQGRATRRKSQPRRWSKNLS